MILMVAACAGVSCPIVCCVSRVNGVRRQGSPESVSSYSLALAPLSRGSAKYHAFIQLGGTSSHQSEHEWKVVHIVNYGKILRKEMLKLPPHVERYHRLQMQNPRCTTANYRALPSKYSGTASTASLDSVHEVLEQLLLPGDASVASFD